MRAVDRNEACRAGCNVLQTGFLRNCRVGLDRNIVGLVRLNRAKSVSGAVSIGLSVLHAFHANTGIASQTHPYRYLSWEIIICLAHLFCAYPGPWLVEDNEQQVGPLSRPQALQALLAPHQVVRETQSASGGQRQNPVAEHQSGEMHVPRPVDLIPGLAAGSEPEAGHWAATKE